MVEFPVEGVEENEVQVLGVKYEYGLGRRYINGTNNNTRYILR